MRDEQVEVVDEKGKVVGVVPRADMRAGNLRHRSVGIVVCDGSRVLVHQRADWKDVWPSRWDLAFGGVCDVGEAYPAAALRELHEEAGIVVGEEELLDLGDGWYDDDEVRVVARLYALQHPGALHLHRRRGAVGRVGRAQRARRLGRHARAVRRLARAAAANIGAMTVAGHVDEIAERGYTIIPDAFDLGYADALLADLDRLHAELDVRPAANGFEGTSTLRVYNLLVHGELWQQVPVHPNVLPVVERVLDAGCLISSLSSIDIRPGETAQPIHADDQLMPIPKPHPPTVCNTMWALTDFTDANGATRLVPGSHTAADHPIFGGDYETVPAEMPRGSVLVWHGSLWHGGGANATDERRVGIAMNYCAGYIRQQENQQLGVPPELVRTFPERLQQLVGYSVYTGLIGHIEKQDPRALLMGGSVPSGMVWDAS